MNDGKKGRNFMSKSKILTKKIFLLVAILLFGMTCNSIVYSICHHHIVGDFDVRYFRNDIADAEKETQTTLENGQVLRHCALDSIIDDMLNKSQEVNPYPSTSGPYYYGIIAVIRPIKNTNHLRYYPTNHQEPGKAISIELGRLDKLEYASLTDLRASKVKTEAEILEIIYQENGLNFSVGDRVDINELYYIADQRIPKVLEQVQKNKAQKEAIVFLDTWSPLEIGETYFVCAVQCYWPDKPEYNGLTSLDGYFCLSNPDKKSGLTPSDELLKENLEYLKKSYPELTDKYLK